MKKTLIAIGRWHRNVATGEVARTAVLASLIAALLASSVAMVSAAMRIDIGPQVGDILVFRRGAHMPTDWNFTVTTTAMPAAICSLRPAIMVAEGGSLVVEQRLEGLGRSRCIGPAYAPARVIPTVGTERNSSCRRQICNCCRTSLVALA